jgi:hypothetical protein
MASFDTHWSLQNEIVGLASTHVISCAGADAKPFEALVDLCSFARLRNLILNLEQSSVWEAETDNKPKGVLVVTTE